MTNKAVSRIAIAFLCVVGLALLVFIGFMAIIVIACGQYKPPVHEDDSVVMLQLSASSVKVPNGSYWTDGAICYEAKRQGKTLQLKGWSLHEGGMECAFTILNDTLMQVMEDGTFAEAGSLVTHHFITQESGKQVELLVAWEDSTLTIPYAALERFDGNLDAYEEKAYYRALAGLYVDEKDSTIQWLFTPDGRVREEYGMQPVPYKIERIYHSLTDVIAYPYLNPKRISFMLTKQGLRLCGAVWNEEEEYWETDYTETGSMFRKEAPNWLGTQMFCLPMAVLMVDDYTEELMHEAFMSDDLFSQLNGHLMYYYLYNGASNFEPIGEDDPEEEEE